MDSASALEHIGTASHADQRSSDFSSPEGPAARQRATIEVASELRSSPAQKLPCSTVSEGSACIGKRTFRSRRLEAKRERPGSSDSKSSSPAADPATPTSAMSVDSLMPLASVTPEVSPACCSRRYHKRTASGTGEDRSGTLRGGSSGVRRAQGAGHVCTECGCIRTPVWYGSAMPIRLPNFTVAARSLLTLQVSSQACRTTW